MTTLLHINASAQLGDRSLTRQLGQRFLTRWRSRLPDTQIIERDLGLDPVPAIDQSWIAAAFTPPAKRSLAMNDRLAFSDTLIDEVSTSDVIVIGAPMYNYGMPAALKGWFDQVARIGCTFSFDLTRGDYPIEPMLSGKKLVVLSARGEFGFAPGGIRAHLNALDIGIAACAHYLGVAHDAIHTVAIEYQEFKDQRHRASIAAAHTEAQQLADRLAAELSAPDKVAV